MRDLDDPSGRASVLIEDFVGYLSQLKLAGRPDVVDIFGGVKGVGKFGVRRRLLSGENFDLVTGFDLGNPSHQRCAGAFGPAPALGGYIGDAVY